MSAARVSLIVLAVSILTLSTSFAQPAGPGVPRGKAAPAAGPGFRGTGGTGSSPISKQFQLDAIKDQLSLSDDEWKALSPKVEKAIDAKLKLNTGAGMNWTSSNGSKPAFQASTARPDTPAGKAMQDVREAAADEAASSEELVKRIAAVREARKKARADYEAAQQELNDALTPRQQAVLMTLGVIE
jgi:hypothetical protein